MQTKLTLRMDEELIEKAKTWAAARGISLSQAVAGFFAQLPDDREPVEHSAWMRSLSGIAVSPDARCTSESEVLEEYVDYLERKYGRPTHVELRQA